MHLIPIASLRVTVAVILSFSGLLFAVWSNVGLNRIGKGGPLEVAGVEISPKTETLVTTGPYKYTRNPMLFGTCLFYYGEAVYLNSVIASALVTVFMIFMLVFVKKVEEPRLVKDFGTDYEWYRQQVSMFIPRIQKRQRFKNV
jgi:protein-S-isoprenylcysteine O-methyltransferase Ste14